MGYSKQLEASARWLESVQNDDGGFGVVPGQLSTLVNTAEAAFVLKRAGKIEPYHKALGFIRRNWKSHIEKYGPKVRYVAFSLYAFADAGYPELASHKQECTRWLLKNQTPSTGSWPAASDVMEDCVFSTFLANWALAKSGYSGEAVSKSQRWLLSQSRESLWALTSGGEASYVATSYAVLSIAGSPEASSTLEGAKSFLLQATVLPEPEESVVGGTTWKHATHAWLIPALLALGEDPYAPVIARTVRMINRLRDGEVGWRESAHQSGRTVRGQFWAVYALESIRVGFDPDKHPLRIDAERAETTHKEPAFVKFNVQSSWAVVLPAKVYRGLVYGCALVVLFLLSGAHEGIVIPGWADRAGVLLGVGFIAGMVKVRRTLFPRMAGWLRAALLTLPVLNVVFGVTLMDCIDRLESGFRALKSYLTQWL